MRGSNNNQSLKNRAVTQSVSVVKVPVQFSRQSFGERSTRKRRRRDVVRCAESTAAALGNPRFEEHPAIPPPISAFREPPLLRHPRQSSTFERQLRESCFPAT
jgi:hypothetical protein